MGGLTGLSSQAHAHYGLPHLAFSDEPSVLKSDPRRFAVPPTVHTFGADFAESYTVLAALAARLPGGERLALTQAGAAAHHIEDVANQIHTVQVGIYAFFVDAKIDSIKEELLSVGGLLRPRPSFVSIGHRHHLQSSHPRRVAVRQAPARSERSRRQRERWRRDRRRSPPKPRACTAGVRTHDHREADRSVELRRPEGLRRNSRRRPTPLVARRAALRRERRSRRCAQARRRSRPASSISRSPAPGAGSPPSATGGRASAPARRSTTPPPAGWPSSWCATGSTRSTPPKRVPASTPRSRPMRTGATGGSRSVISSSCSSSSCSCVARAEEEPDPRPARTGPLRAASGAASRRA